MDENASNSNTSGTVYCLNCCDKILQKNNTKLKNSNNVNSLSLFKSKDKSVSLLSIENITNQMDCSRLNKKNYEFKPCDFGENITTKGINLSILKVGEKLKIGNKVILKICKTGKNCYKYCSLYNKTTGCIISKEFIFCKIIKEGDIKIGDKIVAL